MIVEPKWNFLSEGQKGGSLQWEFSRNARYISKTFQWTPATSLESGSKNKIIEIIRKKGIIFARGSPKPKLSLTRYRPFINSHQATDFCAQAISLKDEIEMLPCLHPQGSEFLAAQIDSTWKISMKIVVINSIQLPIALTFNQHDVHDFNEFFWIFDYLLRDFFPPPLLAA